MSLVIKFYFTSSMLNMFRTLYIHHQEPVTFLLYHHIGHVFLFRCVLEFLWLCWGGIRVAGFCLKQEHMTNVVIQ